MSNNIYQKTLLTKLEQLEHQVNLLQNLMSEFKKEIFEGTENSGTIIQYKKKAVDLAELAPQLSEIHNAVLSAIGGKGISYPGEIVTEVADSTGFNENQIYEAIKELREKFQVLNEESPYTILAPRKNMYSLNYLGRFLYKYLFNQEPVLSEADSLKKYYDTLEKAVCVKDVANFLSKKGYKTIIFPLEDNTVEPLDKETLTPEIIAVTNTDEKRYWKIETGYRRDQEIADMLHNAIKTTNTLYIIVGNENNLSKFKHQVERYYALRKFSKEKAGTMPSHFVELTIYIGSIKKLQSGSMFLDPDCKIVFKY